MDLLQKYAELLRYGARVFDAEAHRQLLLRYRRYYLRKLAVFAARPPHGTKSAAKHLRDLKLLGFTPGALDMLDSMLDWPLGKLGLRPLWRERP